MTTTFTTASGRTAVLPEHVDPTEVRGLDHAGRIVVEQDWMREYLFGLTLCCNAFDKGVEDGVVCRHCYGPENGNYLFRAPDGSVSGLDPVTLGYFEVEFTLTVHVIAESADAAYKQAEAKVLDDVRRTGVIDWTNYDDCARRISKDEF